MPTSPTSEHARLTRIFHKHAQAAYRTIVCCGAPAAEAEDCVTRTFEIVYERLDAIRPTAERAYVCAVAARVAANARRAQKRRVSLFAQLDWEQWQALPAQGSSDALSTPEQAAIRSGGLAKLQRSLDNMTDKQREVFVLCELEQLSSRQAAQSLDIPVTAVQARRRKANAAFEKFCREQPLADSAPQPSRPTFWKRRRV